MGDACGVPTGLFKNRRFIPLQFYRWHPDVPILSHTLRAYLLDWVFSIAARKLFLYHDRGLVRGYVLSLGCNVNVER